MPHDPGPPFRALHQRGNPFVLMNAWDVGSARVLAALGAQAIGTTSAGHAFTLGVPDGGITRDQALAHASDLVAAAPLPVSGDFANGFGEAPEAVAGTVRLAGEAGLAGVPSRIPICRATRPARSIWRWKGCGPGLRRRGG